MVKVSRFVVFLRVLLWAVVGVAGSALADPASSPPRPGAGPDQHSQSMKLLASLPRTGTTSSDIAFWGAAGPRDAAVVATLPKAGRRW